MSNALHKCMCLAIVFLLSIASLQATSSIDAPLLDRSTKEIIVINYNQFAIDEVSSLVEYACSTYHTIDNALITIKDYSKGSAENKVTFNLVLAALKEAGITTDNIKIEKAVFEGASEYFSISIGSSTQVQ